MLSTEISPKAQAVVEAFKKKLTRQAVLSLATCVNCGMCNESCHYYVATGDPKMTPAYKAGKVRKLFKYHVDWLGRVAPGWVGAKTLQTDDDLADLKDVVYGSCSMCRRCTVACPFGGDTALIMRLARGLLTAEGLAPEGVLTVSKDQWEIGNQMGVSQEDYLETIDWLQDELRSEVGDPQAAIPIDKPGANVLFLVNPREVKYAPLSLLAAAKIFYAAGEDWTMPSVGWDNTNFGLFSGDDKLGAHMGKLAYNQARKLAVKKVVISECGHGFRATKWEAPNWAAEDLPFPMESLLETMVEYVNSGRIHLDPTANPRPVTYHDPCNLSRSAGITEEPRFLLKRACLDFREMTPNRQESYCCTGGGGAMSMAEYAPRRLKVGSIKANQIKTTGAASVATACHNCVDGLSDLIKHYQINIPVRNVCEYVADAVVLHPAKVVEPLIPALKGRRILVIEDDADTVTYLTTLLGDHGFETLGARTAAQGLTLARDRQPDLITLDINMPGRSGAEVFAALRSDPVLSRIPVCVVTGAIDFRELMYLRNVPAPDGYLQKPIDANLLLLTVQKILHVRHREEVPETAGAPA
ncbi:MAG TPA: response regulator [Vicinamibacteria bacterium]|nr:response regulator [Vicinamibacteria bacterium]